MIYQYDKNETFQTYLDCMETFLQGVCQSGGQLDVGLKLLRFLDMKHKGIEEKNSEAFLMTCGAEDKQKIIDGIRKVLGTQ